MAARPPTTGLARIEHAKPGVRKMRTAQFWKRFWWTFSLIAGSAANAFGQTAAASISGRVTDAQQAVVVGATVELISVQRGTKASTTTNQAGLYSFQIVPAGEYRLLVRSQGFRQAEVQSLGGGRRQQH
jgi:hypothetical protein